MKSQLPNPKRTGPAARCFGPARAWGFAALIALAAAPLAGAAERTDAELLKSLATEPARDRAVRRGLAFLRGLQQPDGSVAGPKHRAALTAVAVLAHLSSGHPVSDSEHGPWLRKGLKHVLSVQDDTGYFGRSDDGRFYGHGLAVLALAGAAGTTGDDELEESLRRALDRAVGVTVAAAGVAKSPGEQGGWRYHPKETTSDLSVTGWQLLSLRAARQAGAEVPDSAMAAALRYVKRLVGPDGRVGYTQPKEDSRALRGLGLLALAIGGQGDSPEAAVVAERIQTDPPVWRGPWFFYRACTDALGLSAAAPEAWSRYAPKLEAVLIERQKADGSWLLPPNDNEGQFGPAYAAAMSVLALTVDRRALPMYQY